MNACSLRRAWGRTAPRALWLLALTLIAVGPSAAQVDPFQLLQDDPRRALVVRVSIDANDGAQLVERLVTEAPPRAHIGNPPQILVEHLDVGGLLIGSSFAWDPLWEFVRDADGRESVVELPVAVGSFQVPMSGDLGLVRLTRLDPDDDSDPGIELITVDVADVVLDYCHDRFGDPNCAESNHPPVADAGGPYEVAVGNSVALDGSGSYDPDDDALVLRWDLDRDLVFGETGNEAVHGDELGSAPVFRGGPVPGTLVVAVEVCDPSGSCSVAGGTVEVLPAGVDDADGDGVPDVVDLCPDTVVPEAAPTVSLRPNHFALTGNNGPEMFESSSGLLVTVRQTGGCSCEQIVAERGLGQGHLQFGCSLGVMRTWLATVGGL